MPNSIPDPDLRTPEDIEEDEAEQESLEAARLERRIEAYQDSIDNTPIPYGKPRV